jgi:hypothetical protein
VPPAKRDKSLNGVQTRKGREGGGRRKEGGEGRGKDEVKGKKGRREGREQEGR